MAFKARFAICSNTALDFASRGYTVLHNADPGDGMAALLTYPTGTDHDTELFNRLTDDKSHYYQYLYTALFIKEIEAQWSKAGYPIDTSPETVVTLFNIGFAKSIPNANPQAGGAEITTGNTTYAYGELGADFYHSDELTDIFPN